MKPCPIIHCRGPEADRAWQIHSALVRAERDAPALSYDPRFVALREEAYRAFHDAFEVAA